MGDIWADVRNRDPISFVKADYFFRDFNEPSPDWVNQPSTVSYVESDNTVNSALRATCTHGRIFRFENNALLLIQFLRPSVWRIRFHEVNTAPENFTDYNTRTIVQDTATDLIKKLDDAEEVSWHVELQDTSDYYTLKSVIDSGADRTSSVKLYIKKRPFQIIATSYVTKLSPFLAVPDIGVPNGVLNGGTNGNACGDDEVTEAVIWQTKERGLQYGHGAVVLSVQKTPTARYVGFGEQGGRNFAKDKTFMNYFNYDNMRYRNVYGKGPEYDAEPLYHSDPYFIEVNALPSFKSQVATFIDNYSHVCLDLGNTEWSLLRLATRFNSFQALLFAGATTQDIIQSYTSLVGRPRLKPRYVLGYHQGCYGYDTQGKVIEAIKNYRDLDYPIDGMHVDVDIQDNYRTFSINLNAFPDPKGMFRYLRDQGVKCSTNITPVISSRESDWYTTLKEGLKKGYFVKDVRNLDPTLNGVTDHVRYCVWDGGNQRFLNPSDKWSYDRPYNDRYDLNEVFNKAAPFHGGVDYGFGNGSPGHYPNLNNEEVREWWGRQYQNLFDTGLEFVWQDMTSPCMSQIFGDMKSWPFRLMLDSDGWSGDPDADKQKMAIEIWSLYSYNLHKATYKGLNKLPGREGKRNFIIGRGSFTGAHRYAGLWTGDNSSTWEFFNISVAQVIALGLSGVTIAGADVGGFEPPDAQDNQGGPAFCDPELFIRWNCAYSLLPWYRNHYSKKGSKQFQEPYAFEDYYQKYKKNSSDADRAVYQAVHPIVRYYIRLRYTLLQLLYDAMFENMLNGLPIARAMIITDSVDGSLYAQNVAFTRSQYLVRNDVLVCPALFQKRDTRRLYLPAPDGWFPFNLRAFDQKTLGDAISKRVEGGTYVDYYASITAVARDTQNLPYVLPMYIREGAIVPQIDPRLFVPDRTDSKQAGLEANPITLNIYPGKDQTYNMYLDDGISRESAPETTYVGRDEATLGNDARKHRLRYEDAFGDEEARSIFNHVKISHTTSLLRHFQKTVELTRKVTITTPWAQYPWNDVQRDIGSTYKVVLWHEPGDTSISLPELKINGNSADSNGFFDNKARATVVDVPVQVADPKAGLTVGVTFQRSDIDWH